MFPLDDDYHVGVEVTLSANANPLPKFKWVDPVTKSVLSENKVITLTLGMPDKLCGVAYNVIGGKTYTNKILINVFGGERTSHATWIRVNRTLFIICNFTWLLHILLCML